MDGLREVGGCASDDLLDSSLDEGQDGLAVQQPSARSPLTRGGVTQGTGRQLTQSQRRLLSGSGNGTECVQSRKDAPSVFIAQPALERPNVASEDDSPSASLQGSRRAPLERTTTLCS